MATPEYAPRGDALTAVPGIKVGHWSDRRSATGCTAVLCEGGATPGFFQPGGAPGTLDTDLMRSENAVQAVHGLLLTGGSLWGLEAAGGVKRYLRERQVGMPMPSGDTIPIVSGAVVFDLPVGKFAHPGVEDGYRAARNATAGRVAQGSIGVGTGCTVAKTGAPGTSLKSGVGTAALRHESGLIVSALVAVNAVGDVVDPSDGSLVAGARGNERGEMQRASEVLPRRSIADYEALMQARVEPERPGAATTLCVVATNARLHKGTATRVAIMASAGLSRTIAPVFTPGDGDTVFALATGEIDIREMPWMITLIGELASQAVAESVLRSVRTAHPLAGIPSVGEWTGAAT